MLGRQYCRNRKSIRGRHRSPRLMLEAYWMPVPAAKGIFRNRMSGKKKTCQPQRCHVPGLGFLWWARTQNAGETRSGLFLDLWHFRDIRFFLLEGLGLCVFLTLYPCRGHATFQSRYIFVGPRPCLRSEAGRVWHRSLLPN